MHAKYAAIGLLMLLALVTIILQMTVLGNYEELVELEYEEYQIRIDYNKMAEGILELFGSGKRTRHKRNNTAMDQERIPESDGNALAPVLKPAPTAPVLRSLDTVSGESYYDK